MKLIRKFIPYYKPYIGIFLLDLLCASIMSAIDLAFPQFMRILRATLYLEAPEVILKRIGLVAALLIAMYAVRSLCKYYVTYQGHMMGARMESTMRRELFDRFEAFSFSYYDTHNTGEMMSKLVSDLFDVSELAHHGPENIFISVVKIIGSFILLTTAERSRESSPPCRILLEVSGLLSPLPVKKLSRASLTSQTWHFLIQNRQITGRWLFSTQETTSLRG